MRIFHHESGVETHKVVFSHIVCQISKDERSLLGLIDGRAVDFYVVSSPINVILLSNVIDDLWCWHNSAIAHIEMEKCQEVVHVVCLHEIRSFQRQVEPSWYGNCFVATNVVTVFFQEVLTHLHVDLICVRIEVEHDRLFEESVLAVHPSRNLIQILINSLLQEQATCINTVNMCLDIRQCLHSLLQLPAWPLLLDANGCTCVNDLIDWQLWTRLAPLVCFVCVPNGGGGCHTHQ